MRLPLHCVKEILAGCLINKQMATNKQRTSCAVRKVSSCCLVTCCLRIRAR